MAVRGRIDGVFDGVVRGWLWDPDRPQQRFEAELLLDGRSIGRPRADLPRADLEGAGFGEGGPGLEFALPIVAQDGGVHVLRLEADHGVMLDEMSLLVPPRLHMLRGRVERVYQDKCLGWTWDRARPEEAVEVELVHAGEVCARQRANLPRPDLARARIGDGRHGFAIDLATLDPRPTTGAEIELRCSARFGEWPLGRFVMPEAPSAPATAKPAGPPPRARPAVAKQALARADYLDAARKAEGERNYPEAARLLDAGLATLPGDFDLLSVRARIHLVQQEMEPAERLARAALAVRPEHSRAVVLLARISTALGRHADAADFWARIRPEDSAFRERLAKRPRSLLALDRTGEALGEIAMAVAARPDDIEILRLRAETAEAVGAPRAALSHWLRVLARFPEDGVALQHVATLRERLAPQPADALRSPLVNPDLRDWRGLINNVAQMEPVSPADGVALRSLGGQLSFSPVAPRHRRLGELPGYGLLLRAEGGGAEAAFALGPDALGSEALGPDVGEPEASGSDAGTAGYRMGLEASAGPGSVGLELILALRQLGTDHAGERCLDCLLLEERARLYRFDLRLTEEETRALRSGGLELVLRLPQAGMVQFRPPRPLSRLRQAAPAVTGFETPGLDLALLPGPGRAWAWAAPDDALMDLACPFTSIAIAAEEDAVAATIVAVVSGTAAPFECVVTLEAHWPAALLESLRRMAAEEPRLRLLSPGAASPAGWVALIEAPPAGGRHWLSALHRAAAASGQALAPGVLLEWCD